MRARECVTQKENVCSIVIVFASQLENLEHVGFYFALFRIDNAIATIQLKFFFFVVVIVVFHLAENHQFLSLITSKSALLCYCLFRRLVF